MALTAEQARIVADLKAGQPGRFVIPIRSGPEAIIGRLIPITHSLAQDPRVIDALYRWRKTHMAAFLTVFVPTPEKTHNYLSSFSLPDPARILFLITDHESRFVGHCGLCNIAAADAEIDNVVRGETIGVPDFMVLAHRALLRWAFTDLGLSLVYLSVLAHNARAIRTYEKAGLAAISRTPLAREETDDGYRLVPTVSADEAPRAATLVRMEISRQAFYANAPQARLPV